jgi:hypothetical protein
VCSSNCKLNIINAAFPCRSGVTAHCADVVCCITLNIDIVLSRVKVTVMANEIVVPIPLNCLSQNISSLKSTIVWAGPQNAMTCTMLFLSVDKSVETKVVDVVTNS